VNKFGKDQKVGKSNTNKSYPLERYFTILEILAALPKGITQTELSKISGLPKPAIHRLITSLIQSGLVAVNEEGGKLYSLGQRMRHLAALSLNDDIVSSATHLVLAPLTRLFNETCFVVRFDGTVIRSLAMSAPERGYRLHIEPGFIIPAHAGASSKVILCYQNEEIIRSVVGKSLEVLTDSTHTSIDKLLKELRIVRQQGFAHCDGEIDENTAAYACPVHSTTGEVQFSIAVTGPRDRMHERLQSEYIAALQKSAKKFEEYLTNAASKEVLGSSLNSLTY
jgi:DNA-binding IclR family transcriptional regulator